MMGIVVPETCWAYKKYNKIISGIYLVSILQLSQWCTVQQISNWYRVVLLKICRNAARLVKIGTGHREIQVILHASRALIRQILTGARSIPNQHTKRKITHTIMPNDFSVVLWVSRRLNEKRCPRTFTHRVRFLTFYCTYLRVYAD